MSSTACPSVRSEGPVAISPPTDSERHTSQKIDSNRRVDRGLEDFKPRVMEEISKLHGADYPRTIEFYEQTFRRLLTFKPLAKANLRDIDEELIARFSSNQMGVVNAATVNRALAVLRRTLYLAVEWKLIDRSTKGEAAEGRTPPRICPDGSSKGGVHRWPP